MANWSLANEEDPAAAAAAGASSENRACSAKPKKSKSKKGCDCCVHHNSKDEALKMDETEEMRAMMVKTLMYSLSEFCR